MDAVHVTSEAEQIKTDTHQTACVKNESSPPYEVQARSEEEKIIAQALEILSDITIGDRPRFSDPMQRALTQSEFPCNETPTCL